MAVRGQVVTTGESVTDISIPAVKTFMDIYGVRDQLRCLGMVKMLFFHFLAEANIEGQ